MKITTTDIKPDERVETGPLQINEDWTGLFIRGDNAFFLAQNIDMLIDMMTVEEKSKYSFMINQLQGLSDMIKNEVVEH